MTSLTNIMNKLSDRRRNGAIIDPNADRVSYRPSGDPRLDLAMSTRRF